jgi:hypothetical protein
MRRIRTGLGLVALAGLGATVGLTAPAHASTASSSGYVLYNYYNWPDQCSSIGYAGEQSGQWAFYYCDTIDPASSDGPGLYALYVDY